MVVKDRTARSVGLIVGLLKALVSETVLNRRFWRELCSHFPRPSAHNYFSPLLFPAPGQRPEEQNVFLFQTLAIRDFVATFSKAALERFTDQYGVFIAHTYFAFLGAHHSGKPFLDREGGLNADAQRALGLLGKAITDGKVWNPPLSELHSFWSRLLKMELRYENRQWIWINAPAGLATRWLR
jgi:hypothetical protein